MADAQFYIILVWNGNKRQVADKMAFDDERAWQLTIDTMPFDVIDVDEHNCWVDYGDL